MAKTIVETIIDTLGDELTKYIKVSRGYRTTPTVIFRGAFSPNEVQAFPVIGYDITSEDFSITYQGGNNIAFVAFDLYGYTFSDNMDRIKDVRDLAHDVLYFINNDFSLSHDTEITGPLEYGGYQTLIFRLPIRVVYDYDEESIK